MKRKLTMFLALFFIGIGLTMAQTQVRGIVVDESGDPVIGATIQIIDTSISNIYDKIKLTHDLSDNNVFFDY